MLPNNADWDCFKILTSRENHVWTQNFRRSNWKITMLGKSAYLFVVLWHRRSCQEMCRKVLWAGEQNDSTTLQGINSMHWRLLYFNAIFTTEKEHVPPTSFHNLLTIIFNVYPLWFLFTLVRTERLTEKFITVGVSGLCSAMRPNQEPLRGSAQFAPSSVSSKLGKRGGLSGRPKRLRWNDFWEWRGLKRGIHFEPMKIISEMWHATRKMCVLSSPPIVCTTFANVCTLNQPEKTVDLLATKFAPWLGDSRNLFAFVPFLPSVPILSFLPLMSYLPCVEDEDDACDP